MKRLIVSITALLFAVSAIAQDQIAAIKDALSTSRMTASYEYDVDGKVPLAGTGTITVQDNCYMAQGNGILFLCNGITSWTVDESSKEVYIENGEGTDFILGNIDAFLEHVSGLKVTDTKVSGCYTDPGTGAKAHFKLWDIKRSKKADRPGEFCLDTSSLGKDWVVTDLR